ncbi:MAG: efflux transporter outer membrane subunit [Flavobacteriales bacterium]|nr:efflux transporter outer membrane subunit [Flavobacteriales bacterium]
MRRVPALLLAALPVLAGCSLVPEASPPEVASPPAYANAQQAGLTAASLAEAGLTDSWWTGFGSPDLDRLMAAARAGNLDIKAALARIAQARAQVRGAEAGLYPTFDASGSAGRSGNAADPDSNSYRGNLQVGYELDLWGRVAAGVTAAEAGAQATALDAVALDLVLQGDVATTYFTYLALGERLRVAEENLAIARGTLALVQEQAAAGAVSGLELAQQRQQVAAISAQIPDLEGQRRQAVNALALLAGTTTAALGAPGGALAEVAVPQIQPGVPSDLLLRRPDLRGAEAELVAANANIGAARAAFLPSIALTAEGGIASNLLNALLRPESLLYSLAASLVAPIFDGGAREADLEVARARYEELVYLYQQSALTAFREVEDALVDQETQALSEAALVESERQARQAYNLAALQYREGAIDLLTLLDAQRTLLSAQDSLVQARLSRLSAAVALAKALGGGWQGGLPQ